MILEKISMTNENFQTRMDANNITIMAQDPAY